MKENKTNCSVINDTWQGSRPLKGKCMSNSTVQHIKVSARRSNSRTRWLVPATSPRDQDPLCELPIFVKNVVARTTLQQGYTPAFIICYSWESIERDNLKQSLLSVSHSEKGNGLSTGPGSYICLQSLKCKKTRRIATPYEWHTIRY